MKHTLRSLLIMFTAAVIGCSGPALVEVNTSTDKVAMEEAFNAIKGVIVSNGFDIKDENLSAGFITTTYKKWSYTKQSSGPSGGKGESKRITLRMQLRLTMTKAADGKINIVLTPGVKQHEQDLDPSFLEAAVDIAKFAMSKTDPVEDLGDDARLEYFEEDDRESGFLTSDEKKIRQTMLKAFLKTSNEIAGVAGVSKEQLKFIIVN
ncbi:MAG: hypothetical protein HUU02_08760 [Bacteroidetes bacterium]|nr:hypothetical protein [Bacteroidota bacterium]